MLSSTRMNYTFTPHTQKKMYGVKEKWRSTGTDLQRRDSQHCTWWQWKCLHLNALLIFISGTKSEECHHGMNFHNYERWLRIKLIPNLPPDSVLVVNTAAYHNVQLNLPPTSSSRKSSTIDWLSDCGISLSDQICKPRLYSLIKLLKPWFKTFKTDVLVPHHGQSVLWLLPYHPDLNLTELIWEFVKDYITRKNVSFCLEMPWNWLRKS
jgi:hypothetical protein